MMETKHCDDCCCAQSWKALGIDKYTGKSIPEHIEQLREKIFRLAVERDDLKVELDETAQACANLAYECVDKDKALRAIKSALDAFGKMESGSNTLFERVQAALDAAEKAGE